MFPIRDTVPSRRPPFVTWTLIAVNGLVFLFEQSLDPQTLDSLFYWFGLVPARYTHPAWAIRVGLPLDDYWPLLTSMFLHGGWLHLVGNMWTLWIFGDNVEERMGPLRFALFYLLTGLVAGLTHGLTNPSSTIPTVGASGAIAGVLGAYFVLFPRARIVAMFPVFFWPFFFELPAATYLVLWYLSQVLTGTLAGMLPARGGGVAWWAHAGGFAAGVLLHRLFLLPRRSAPRRLEPDEYGIEGAWLPLQPR
jgi:membrane associated rhomboid family serine protease